MKSTSLIYSPLKEEEKEVPSWDKRTLEYAVEREKDIKQRISNIAKSINGKKLSYYEVEDIYSDALYYFYSCSDYSIEKARSKDGKSIVSLSGYVNTCIRYCVLRYIINKAKTEYNSINETIINEDGKEVSLLDTVQGSDEAEITISLEEVCKEYESDRYIMGDDIYQIWYVKLLGMKYDKSDDIVQAVLEALGVSKKEFKKYDIESEDGMMKAIAKAITACGIEHAIEVLGKYTYGADKIEKAIMSI